MKNIVLIGFMGSGKTVVGKELAKRLKLQFKDTDSLIEERLGQKITAIFADKGENFFRDMESQIIDELTGFDNQVISCGGGAILRNENVNYLKKNGILVYLKAPFELLYDRIKSSTNRPLLRTAEPEQQAKKLWQAREKVYEGVADLNVDTSRKSVDEIVLAIEKEVRTKDFSSPHGGED